MLAAGVLAVAAWLVVPLFTTSESVRDARAVFCLQPAERAALADAAVALGVAGEGSSAGGMLVDGVGVPLTTWRREHEADFDRTCDALAAVRNVPAAAGTQARTVLQPFLLAVLTAALTFVTTYRKDRAARSQTVGDALRDSVRTFAEAANAYLDGFVGFPATSSPAAMDIAREDLVGRLRGVHRGHPSWRAVGDVIGWLDDGDLRSAGEQLSRIRDASVRGNRIDALKAEVAMAVAVGNQTANSLADPAGADKELKLRLTEMSKR